MTEEVKEQTDENKPGNVEPVEVLSDTEAQARELGWLPKEEFEAIPENAGKKWRSAEDFLDRKSFFDKIEQSNREIKNLRKALQALAQHNQKIEKLSYEKALQELKKERDQALEEHDLVKAEKLRDSIDELKTKIKEQPEPVVPESNAEFNEWIEKNQWYKTDIDMRAYAEGYAVQLWNSGVRDPSVALPMIEKKVKEVFSQKFKNPGKAQVPGIEGGTRKDPTKKQDNFQLTEEEERILNTMLRAGAPITREEYIKQLKAVRG